MTSHPATANPNSADRATEVERQAAARSVRNRWLLSAPALAIITMFAAGPLMIVLVYSFLSPGEYGNVEWQFSVKAWFNVILQRDIFDNSLQWADAHLNIFWRSV